jgi:hypothetical protein
MSNKIVNMDAVRRAEHRLNVAKRVDTCLKAKICPYCDVELDDYDEFVSLECPKCKERWVV